MTAAVAILAGGASRRMGRDKALLTIGGETLLRRTARLALAAAPTVVVIGRQAPAGWDLPTRFLADDRPGDGPLAAIAGALRATGAATVVLPCDLPRLTAAALGWLVASSAQAGAFGLTTLRGGHREPLFAVWLPAALPAIDAALAAGTRSCQPVLADPRFAAVALPAEHAPALDDCDDADDWRRLGGDA